MCPMTFLAVAAFVAITRAVHAQTIGPGPRLDIVSCPAADSILGPASKDVLRAEVHGSLGPGTAYDVRTGPTSFRNELPQGVSLSSRYSAHGLLPAGSVTAFFPASVLERSRDQSEPIELVIDDTLSLPLSTPMPPAITGPSPPSLPFSGLLRPEDLLLLANAHKAKLTFLGKSVTLNGSTIKESQAAMRLATCQLASAQQ